MAELVDMACNFGQTERSLKIRIAEHKKAVASFDQNSKVASYVHQFSHNMNFANVKVTGVESNYHERLFHEALHSTVDPNAGNDHIVLPEAPGQKPTNHNKPSTAFFRPKELDDSDRQKSGIVYKINCTQCNFVYYGQQEDH